MTLAPKEITPSEFYDANLPSFKLLNDEVLFALQRAVKASGVKTHTLATRIKEKESLLKKIEEKNYENLEAQVEDFVGARVVCLFSSDLPILGKVVRETFNVVREENKDIEAAVDSFGYLSVHYVCTIRADNSGARYSGLHGIKFEVQCRTILQDAWANVSHYLAYKGEASIPEALKRDFHALAGLFYVADKHFEMFFEESRGSQAKAVESLQQMRRTDESEAIPVNRDTVVAYLSKQFPERSENLSLEHASTLVQELVASGYKTITDIARDIDRAKVAAEAYEADYPPRSPNKKYTSIGLARQALALANPIFLEVKYPSSKTAEQMAKYRHLVK